MNCVMNKENKNYYVVTATFLGISDVYLTKATSEEEAFTKVYSIECGLDDDEEV